MIIKIIIYFVVGIIESFGISLNTKFIQRNKKLYAFCVSVCNILIWGFVLLSFLDGLAKYILAFYALGYATGEVLGITFDNYLEKLAKIKGLSFKKKLKYKRRKKR